MYNHAPCPTVRVPHPSHCLGVRRCLSGLNFLDKHMCLDERNPETIREYVEEYNLLALGFQRYCHWGEPYV